MASTGCLVGATVDKLVAREHQRRAGHAGMIGNEALRIGEYNRGERAPQAAVRISPASLGYLRGAQAARANPTVTEPQWPEHAARSVGWRALPALFKSNPGGRAGLILTAAWCLGALAPI